MREKGGGVRVKKEVDRKRDEKKHTRNNNNLKKIIYDSRYIDDIHIFKRKFCFICYIIILRYLHF